MEGTWAGKAGMHVKPEAHRNVMYLGDRARFAVKPEVVIGEELPNTQFDVMKRPGGADAEGTHETIVAGGGAEGGVEGGLVVWESIGGESNVIAVGNNNARLVEAHLGKDVSDQGRGFVAIFVNIKLKGSVVRVETGVRGSDRLIESRDGRCREEDHCRRCYVEKGTVDAVAKNFAIQINERSKSAGEGRCC